MPRLLRPDVADKADYYLLFLKILVYHLLNRMLEKHGAKIPSVKSLLITIVGLNIMLAFIILHKIFHFCESSMKNL